MIVVGKGGSEGGSEGGREWHTLRKSVWLGRVHIQECRLLWCVCVCVCWSAAKNKNKNKIQQKHHRQDYAIT